MENKDRPPMLNICILGNSGIGKTSLFEKFQYPSVQLFKMASTTNVNFGFKYITDSENKQYALRFIDTAGTERYFSLSENFLKSVDIFIYATDIVRGNFDDNNLKGIREWYIRSKMAIEFSNIDRVVTKGIVITKSDLYSPWNEEFFKEGQHINLEAGTQEKNMVLYKNPILKTKKKKKHIKDDITFTIAEDVQKNKHLTENMISISKDVLNEEDFKKCYYTSSKTNINVQEFFNGIIEYHLKKCQEKGYVLNNQNNRKNILNINNRDGETDKEKNCTC